MFEKKYPPNNYITYAEECQAKFDFVKNLTMARAVWTGSARAPRVDDNILLVYGRTYVR